jgi:hypothetical protein
MQRRHFLSLAGLAGLGGCLGYDVVETETVTDRKVRIAELAATVERRDEQLAARETRIDDLEARLARQRDRELAPRINGVALVDGWDRFGDVVHRRIDRVPPGEPARIAVNYTYRFDRAAAAPGATPGVDLVARLRTLEGFTIDRVARRVDLLARRDPTLHETVLVADVDRVPTGTYVAVVELTDRVTGRTAAKRSMQLPVA